jgi:RimJ/RimL family protein N-acetyltransferase
MTEGVRALADYALAELSANCVFLTCDERNLRSCRLAERAGFQLEGVMRRERLDLQKQPRNTSIYACVPDSLPSR